MYAKVFASLFDGSLRGRSDEILVFIDMLVHSTRHGICDRSITTIHEETGLAVKAVKAAIKTLEAKDPESRSKKEGGRRIIRIDKKRTWGWRIVNHAYYRDLCASLNNAERQAKHREKLSKVQKVTGGRYASLRPVSASVSDSSLKKGDYKGDFVSNLKAIYTWLDVDKEIAKLNAWLLATNQEKRITRKLLVGWLNKADTPIDVKPRTELQGAVLDSARELYLLRKKKINTANLVKKIRDVHGQVLTSLIIKRVEFWLNNPEAARKEHLDKS